MKLLELLDREEKTASWQILGPLFVLCTYFLAPHDSYAMLIAGITGIALSSQWQIRGFCYASILLAVVAVAQHAFFTDRHLWQLGLEGSYILAFFITALLSERQTNVFQSLSGQLDARDAHVGNLEEEIAKLREEATAQQMASQEKIAALQKELEEALSERSAILILNEVLRKTSAAHLKEKEGAREDLLDLQRKMALLQSNREEAQKEIARLADGNSLLQENQNLLKQLNNARFDKEQSRLIGETLAREHAKENFRVRQLQEENRQCNERLAALEQKAQLEPQIVTVTAPSPIEALYKQLKGQFEEKNQILHQTRKELFSTDTELQVLKKEREQGRWRMDPLEVEMAEEIATLTEELSRLERENDELEKVISRYFGTAVQPLQ